MLSDEQLQRIGDSYRRGYQDGYARQKNGRQRHEAITWNGPLAAWRAPFRWLRSLRRLTSRREWREMGSPNSRRSAIAFFISGNLEPILSRPPQVIAAQAPRTGSMSVRAIMRRSAV